MLLLRASRNALTKLCAWSGILVMKLGSVPSFLKIDGVRPQYPVLLIDTIGELGRIYSVGDVGYFVGRFFN